MAPKKGKDERPKWEKVKVKGREIPGVYERLSKKYGTGFYIAYWNKGKQIFERVGWKKDGYTPDLAAIVRSERLRSIRHGEELPQDKASVPRFKELADKYKEWSKANKRSYRSDESRISKHLEPRFNEKRLSEISSYDLEMLKGDMKKDGYAPKSIHHILALTKTMYGKAASWGLYAGPNPAEGVKAPAVANERLRFLSHAEAEILLAELKKNQRTKKHTLLKDPVLHDITLLALFSGMRAGEIFGLRGLDVNFRTGNITLRDTKNNNVRHVPMVPAVTAMLKARMPSRPEDLIFKDRHDARIKEVSRSFDRIIKKLKFNVGVDDPRMRITFHSLRHTFLSWSAMSGANLSTLAALAGHRTLQMVKRYAHLSEGHLKDAALTVAENYQKATGKNVVSIDEAKKE